MTTPIDLDASCPSLKISFSIFCSGEQQLRIDNANSVGESGDYNFEVLLDGNLIGTKDLSRTDLLPSFFYFSASAGNHMITINRRAGSIQFANIRVVRTFIINGGFEHPGRYYPVTKVPPGKAPKGWNAVNTEVINERKG